MERQPSAISPAAKSFSTTDNCFKFRTEIDNYFSATIFVLARLCPENNLLLREEL
jgi:hypothetical protein